MSISDHPGGWLNNVMHDIKCITRNTCMPDKFRHFKGMESINHMHTQSYYTAIAAQWTSTGMPGTTQALEPCAANPSEAGLIWTHTLTHTHTHTHTNTCACTHTVWSQLCSELNTGIFCALLRCSESVQANPPGNLQHGKGGTHKVPTCPQVPINVTTECTVSLQVPD